MASDSLPTTDPLLWLRLALAEKVGPSLVRRLLEEFGSAHAIFDASSGELGRAEGIHPAAVRSLLSAETEKKAEKAFRHARELDVALIGYDSPAYPEALKDLAQAPLVVYVRGRVAAQDRLALSVVGPRKPSDYGRLMTRRLIGPLCAHGITIVSGLAHGIDAEAHQAALDCGGRTLAILGQGLATEIYPRSNRALHRKIIDRDQGAIISVFPLDTKPEPWVFPQRNSIIAALSLGTLVVEAGEKSGALITAGHCAELGRVVMACPGDATRTSSRGSNRLIAEGAMMIQRSEDILEILSEPLRRELDALQSDPANRVEDVSSIPSPTSALSGAAAARRGLEKDDPVVSLIQELLLEEHRPVDFILQSCAEAGFGQSEVVEKLLNLEMSGYLTQLPGRIYSLR